tara:strand:+ start:4647 stop:4961 length:315 start_codon:yes stop_codon:yes gene_type:complete
MKEELQVKILELISKSESQLPLIAEEYLSWHLSLNCVNVIIGILLLTSIPIARLIYLRFNHDIEPYLIYYIAATGFGLLLLLGGSYEIIKIKTAPKIYLIDSIK